MIRVSHASLCVPKVSYNVLYPHCSRRMFLFSRISLNCVSQVSHNVCYKHFGHGLFLEDAVEQFNTIIGNLVAGTQHGTLLLSDQRKDWCKEDHPKWVDNCG